MKKSTMIMVVLTVITMGLAIPLGAQESNQSGATAGVFGTDVDSFMDVNSYGDVEFNKWFGFLGGDNSGIVSLGYATKFGNIYLGGFYTGNIFRSGTNETKRLTTSWDPILMQLLTKTDTTIYTQTTTNTNNNIAALIGVAGMGIKLGFSEDITTYNTPYNVYRNNTNTGTSTVTQNVDGSITYSGNDSINYEESKADLMPYIQWGMKLDLGSGTLVPRVGAAINFARDIRIDEFYSSARTELNGKNIAGTEDITRQDIKNDHMRIFIDAGADYYLNDNFYVGLDYELEMVSISNDYSALGKSGSIAGYRQTYAVSSTTNYLDRTEKVNQVNLYVGEWNDLRHTITPAVCKTSTIGDDLQLGVLFSLPIVIFNNTENSYRDQWKLEEETYNDANDSSKNRTAYTERHYAGEKTEKSTLDIAPTVGIGASYNLIPGRFTVNAGVTLNPISYYRESTVTSPNGVNSSYYKEEMGSGSNKYTSSEYKYVDAPDVEDTVQNITSWKGLNGSVAGGFVFNFNENFALDFMVSAVNNAQFSLNLTNLNVMFTFKF